MKRGTAIPVALAFVAGIISGYILNNYVNKEKNNKELEDRVNNELQKLYSNKKEKNDDKVDEEASSVIEKDAINIMKQDLINKGYGCTNDETDVEIGTDFDMEDDETNEDFPNHVYLIDETQYGENEDYGIYSVDYYDGDKVVVDHNDMPITDTYDYIGEVNDHLFKDGKYYVRNDMLERDIEIKYNEGSYGDVINERLKQIQEEETNLERQNLRYGKI